MRRVNLTSLTTPILAVAMAAAPAVLTACGGPNEYAVTGEGPAKSVDVTIEVEETDYGTKRVTIRATFLPPPERLFEDTSSYVAWIVSEDQGATKIGPLVYDEDERTGVIGGDTPHETFTVLVTAEETSETSEPGENVVARQEEAE